MRRLPQLDPELASIEVVRCFGCGRYLGVAPEIKMSMFCEELCWHKAQVINFDSATRNRAIRYLVEQGGHSMVQVARAFGMSRSVVGDILAHGNEGDYLSIARAAPVSDEFRAKRVRAGKISAERRYGGK
jgi:hypothetical protein